VKRVHLTQVKNCLIHSSTEYDPLQRDPNCRRMAISLEESHSDYRTHSSSELRLLYQLYEEAQASRIAHGERLRAILQGRSFPQLVTCVDDADPLLRAIGKGETAGAPRLLERAYARSLDDEAAAAAALRESIEGHPAWP